LPQARSLEARDAQGPRPGGAARGRGRIDAVPDHLQRQRGLDQAKGGPIDWTVVEPLVGRPQAIAVAANAPHPHAGLLFADFVLSPEGQKLLGDMGRVPSSRTQKTLLDAHKHVMVDPIKSLAEAPKWEGLWNELFLK